jgi:hypothetical protein
MTEGRELEIRIPVKLYFTPEGSRTCALNVPEKKYCMFLRTTCFGTKDQCLLNDDRLHKNKEGYVEPSKNCLIKEIK